MSNLSLTLADCVHNGVRTVGACGNSVASVNIITNQYTLLQAGGVVLVNS